MWRTKADRHQTWLLQKEQQEFQAKKDAAEVQYRVQLEKAKNEGIQAQQKKEEYEHKIDMLGLMLDANGEPGKESAQFFESLLGGTEKIDQEELQILEEENKACQEKIQELEEQLQNLEADNEELRDKNEKLQNEVETLSQNIQKAEEEKKQAINISIKYLNE